MQTEKWYENEHDWVLKRSIIFNKNLVQLTFLEIARLLKLLGEVKANAKILDLCCGVGRHSLEFARKGFTVTALDITAPYLEIAAHNAQKEGLKVEFIRENMLNYCEPGKFDIVVNLCTSFGYLDRLEEDLQVLKNIYDSLAINGKFALEILSKEVVARRFQKTEIFDVDDIHVISESRILNDWSQLECKRTITRNNISETITSVHRLFSGTELKGYLHDLGFQDIKLYGDFAGSEYAENAKSLVIVCKKESF